MIICGSHVRAPHRGTATKLLTDQIVKQTTLPPVSGVGELQAKMDNLETNVAKMLEQMTAVATEVRQGLRSGAASPRKKPPLPQSGTLLWSRTVNSETAEAKAAAALAAVKARREKAFLEVNGKTGDALTGAVAKARSWLAAEESLFASLETGGAGK